MPKRIIFASKIILHYTQISMLESLRGHGNGKNYEMAGKIIFQCFCVLSLNYCITPKHLRSPELCARSIKHLNCLTKLLHSLTKHLNFLTKVMHFPKKLCAPLQNFCVLSQNTSFTKVLHSPRNFRSLAKIPFSCEIIAFPKETMHFNAFSGKTIAFP